MPVCILYEEFKEHMGGVSTAKFFVSSQVLDIAHMSPVDHYFHTRVFR